MTATPSRRTLFRAAGLAGLVAGTGGLTACGGTRGQTGEVITSRAVLPAPFTRPLPVPRVLTPSGTEAGADLYRVTARPADAEILPGVRTRIIGYDGTFPGPTIETRSGRPVVVEHVNELPVPMVVHLHGGEVPAAHDGFPTDLVMPTGGVSLSAGRAPTHAAHGSGAMADPRADVVVGRRRYAYPMDQPGATLWYHDHRMDFTGPMVYRGLAGFHLVRDDEEDALALPRGDRELPLMIADRSFDGNGQLDYPARDPSMTREPGTHGAVEGVLGDVVLVNGVPWPQAEVDAARYRLRLLNASNARRYRLVLDPPPPSGDPFVQIGSDGGLLERPVGLAEVRMAPAERFDVLVDFAAYPVGTRVTLRNALGSGGTADVMRFVVARRAADESRVPALLRPFEVLTPAAGRRPPSVPVPARPPGRRLAARVADQRRAVRPGADAGDRGAGAGRAWRFSSDLHHPVHVHLARFQVLSRGSGGPHPTDGGWKDTVDLRPADDVEVAIRFPDLPGRYVMHCHNLEHEDMAMMAAFEVR